MLPQLLSPLFSLCSGVAALGRRLLTCLVLAVVVMSAGCATYKVSHVTDHDGRLYLTTKKNTTLFYVWVLSSEQAIASCKETNDTLNCKELEVTIDGDDWEQ